MLIFEKFGIILFFVLLLFVFGCVEQNDENLIPEEVNLEESISVESDFNESVSLRIATWNLQIFGQKKASNSELLSYYADKISEYDVIVVQEIRDEEQTAFPKLCELLPDFECKVSSRAGKSSSKEQYGIIYRKAILLEDIDYNQPEYQELFERPPLELRLSFEGWNFTLITIHVDPDKAEEEMEYLEELFENNEEDTILLGDLNTDCTYYKENLLQDFEEWDWIITNEEDTTTSNTNCTYDRIIINNPTKDNYIQHGIMNDVTLQQSDHYLAWAEFTPYTQ
ncbi:MAG TPA: endonuclease/exonuclease/phosphatase family protein [archaeon]|nr:endonuclease/exonuclease/phosphatase family protein [archaeon]